MSSDNAAAHVRFHQKLLRGSAAALPSQVFASLPPTHEWVRRAVRWTNETSLHDPTSLIAHQPAGSLPPPAPSLPNPPSAASAAASSLNRTINRALALRDNACYIRAAHTRDRSPLTIAAMQPPVAHCAQPYVHRRDAGTLLLFRAGFLAQDTQRAIDDMQTQATRGVHVPAPAFLVCPDCHEPVNDEDGSSSTACQYRIMLHRFSRCPARSVILNWYHDVAVRSAPTPAVAAMLARARFASAAAASSPYAETDIQAFLHHLLDPAALCRPADATGRRRLLHAATLLLTYLNEDAPRLPPADEFGDLPCIHFPCSGTPVRPLAGTIDSAFWACVLNSAHSVLRPRADEAEAPVGARRNPVRHCRTGKRRRDDR